jgi:hypothetical protein
VAEGELVSLPGRGVVAEAWLCGVVRGRRDSAASCCRADHGSRAEGAAVGAPSRLGRCVACLDFAGAQALAAPRELHGDEGRLGVRTVGLAARAMSGSFGKQNCTDHALHVSYGSKPVYQRATADIKAAEVLFCFGPRSRH